MLSAHGITVRVGARRLLDDISLDVAGGEVVAVVGPNGAGKTTLLRVLSGERRPDAGEVTMAGRSLEKWSLRERARMRAVVSQESVLEFPFTVFDVVLMGRTPHVHRSEDSVDEDVVWRALGRLELMELAHRWYPTLSGGERQRVQLARALAQLGEAPPGGSQYLLLDEPTSSLDIAHQHEALRLARDLAKKDTVVVAVLHDLNLAAQYADRLLLLKGGRGIAAGEPEVVLTPANLRAAFDVESVVLPHPRLGVPLVVHVAQNTPNPKESRT